jgi:putative glutathione S-transferase
MGRLVEGKWTTEWYAPDQAGRFMRDETVFHDRVLAGGSSRFVAAKGRYHLYVSYACPWAHRTLLCRAIKGLDEAITISVVDPFMGDDGWTFSDRAECIPDTVNGARFLRDVYVLAKPDYTGRVTVPVLWDKQERTIVNNESREVLTMLDCEFDAFATRKVSLRPAELSEQIDRTIDELYKPVNNGVYRAGFATKQGAYQEAFDELFSALDRWEAVLSKQRYLCGDRLTEADVCFFTTLLRFDPVYFGHFKCNLRRIADYPGLSGYVRDIYQSPRVAETCRLDHIKEHYYRSHGNINPTRIVPKGPELHLDAPHGRERLGGTPTS